MRTAKLTGITLDWAVAQCEGIELENGCYNRLLVDGRMSKGQSMLVPFKPSADWQQGGAIIERERLSITPREGYWEAYYHDNLFQDDGSDYFQIGTTPLIAAMRCYVASKMGDSVQLPEQLNN